MHIFKGYRASAILEVESQQQLVIEDKDCIDKCINQHLAVFFFVHVQQTEAMEPVCQKICGDFRLLQLLLGNQLLEFLLLCFQFCQLGLQGLGSKAVHNSIDDVINGFLCFPKLLLIDREVRGFFILQPHEHGHDYFNGIIVHQHCSGFGDNQILYVVEVEGDRAVIDDSEDGKNAINSAINTKYLTVVKPAENGSESVEKVELVKGAVVTFTGKKHYSSANGKTPVSCKPGKATITLDPYLKGKHPYHLVAVEGGTSNVYGWVDAEDIYEYNAQKKTEGFKPYLVKVTASALNIRKGAGTSNPVVGCIGDKGIYTIVAEDNGWGKLKSGAGWISLAYTKRV